MGQQRSQWGCCSRRWWRRWALEWPGIITRFCVALANVHELAVVPALAEQTTGILVGDRNYWSPTTTAEWQQHGVDLLAPYRSAKRDPHPTQAHALESGALPH